MSDIIVDNIYNDIKNRYEKYRVSNPELIRNMKMVGLGESLAVRVIEHFGIVDVERILFKENVYRLIEVEGFGFQRTDNIGRLLGYQTDDPRRVAALIYSIVDTNRAFGHVYLPYTILEKECKKQHITQYDKIIDALIRDDILIKDDNRIYTKRLYIAEKEVAQFLRDRIAINDTNKLSAETLNITDLSNIAAICDLDQAKVLQNFQNHNIFLITGGPGSGKSYLIGKLCEYTSLYPTALAAPTGKAAKRMSDLAKKSAKTIHRLLKAGYGTWYYNDKNKLTSYDYIIIDEISMMDLELLWRLLRAIPNTTKLILVGDKDQLPSVGPGSIIRDLIATKKLPVYYLTHNHRQGKGSLIAHNANIINSGNLKLTLGDDINFVEANNPIEIREKIPTLINELKSDGYNLIEDTQVLAPQHSTPIGVQSLNEMLRFIINDKSKASEKFSVGDKVMQTVNDYQLNVFNGYIGRIEHITANKFHIRFFDADTSSIVEYPKSDMGNLMLAYCCTIHKYQGSEAKAGIIVLSRSHVYMWTRNLLYTAITRFREKCIILGDASTFRSAILNTQEQTRYSKLFDRVCGYL